MDECVHHWLIEQPNGPYSRGRCKKCMAVKDFPNSNDGDNHWMTSEKKKQAAKKKKATENKRKAKYKQKLARIFKQLNWGEANDK